MLDSVAYGTAPAPVLPASAFPAAGEPVASAGPGAPEAVGTSLYCYSIMMPFGYEPGLLTKQFVQKVGIFECEEYVIFTNATITLAPGLTTYELPGSLAVPYGGKWGLALNTDVFIRLWKAMAYIGNYKRHDWVIKIDPDCVFFPQRFRMLVTRTRTDQIPGPFIPAGPVFLNNCQFGLHGPVEAVSGAGMTTFLNNLDSCEAIRQVGMDIFPTGMPANMDVKDHGFGEDQYLRRCLGYLRVPMVNEFESLLSERFACSEHPKDCGGMKAAFHAYKSEYDWFTCWQFAKVYGVWPAAPAAPAPVVPVPLTAALPAPLPAEAAVAPAAAAVQGLTAAAAQAPAQEMGVPFADSAATDFSDAADQPKAGSVLDRVKTAFSGLLSKR